MGYEGVFEPSITSTKLNGYYNANNSISSNYSSTYNCSDLSLISFSYKDEELLRNVITDIIEQYIKSESILNEKGKEIKDALIHIRDKIDRHLAASFNGESNNKE